MPENPEPRASNHSSVILVALGASLWGTDSVMRQPLTQALASPVIVLYEHLMLCLIAIPVLISAREELRRLRLRHLLAVIGIAWGGSALATVLFTEAMYRGNVNTAVLLQKLQPLFTFLLAGPLLGERLSRSYWGFLAAGLAGAWLVSFGQHGFSPDFARVQVIAVLCALGAAALWGTSTVLGRLLSAEFSFITITFLRFLVALPLLLAIPMVAGMPLPLPSAPQLLRIMAMAFIPGLAALLIYYRGLEGTPAPAAAIAELAFPLIALLLNWIVLSQRPSPYQLAGFALIWAVVWRLQVVRSDVS